MRSLGMQLIIHLPDERIRQIQEAWHWDRVMLGTNHDFVSADNHPVHNRGLSPFSLARTVISAPDRAKHGPGSSGKGLGSPAYAVEAMLIAVRTNSHARETGGRP